MVRVNQTEAHHPTNGNQRVKEQHVAAFGTGGMQFRQYERHRSNESGKQRGCLIAFHNMVKRIIYTVGIDFGSFVHARSWKKRHRTFVGCQGPYILALGRSNKARCACIRVEESMGHNSGMITGINQGEPLQGCVPNIEGGVHENWYQKASQ